MPEAFTAEEEAELIRLLKKVSDHGGFWPTEECMHVAHGMISYWAPELVIVRDAEGFKEILLTPYEGGIKEFAGKWHIPGGYNKYHHRTIQQSCSAVACRELGVDVEYLRIIDGDKWTQGSDQEAGDHPYGWPLSLYVQCKPLQSIVETDTRRYFHRGHLPENMIVVHRRFAEGFLR